MAGGKYGDNPAKFEFDDKACREKRQKSLAHICSCVSGFVIKQGLFNYTVSQWICPFLEFFFLIVLIIPTKFDEMSRGLNSIMFWTASWKMNAKKQNSTNSHTKLRTPLILRLS